MANPSPFSRDREATEGYELNVLIYSGYLEKNDEVVSAILSAPDGKTYNVTVGNYVGKNYGKIMAINKSHILLIEVVPDLDDNGWVERNNYLYLNKSNNSLQTTKP